MMFTDTIVWPLFVVQSQRLANGTPLKTKSLSGDDNLSQEKANHFLSSGSKRVAVSALSGPEFENLVVRIDKAFAQACGEKLQESIMQPQACRRWLDGERDRYAPFSPCNARHQRATSVCIHSECFGIRNSKQTQFLSWLMSAWVMVAEEYLTKRNTLCNRRLCLEIWKHLGFWRMLTRRSWQGEQVLQLKLLQP